MAGAILGLEGSGRATRSASMAQTAAPLPAAEHRRRCRPPDRRPGLAWDAVGDQRDEDAVATSMERPRTLGELRQSGYKVLSVREEMRKNLIEKIRKNEPLFPGIVGYEERVIPAIENAILAGQDIIFLGERGQAKSRMIRQLVNLLDEETPTLAPVEIEEHGVRR